MTTQKEKLWQAIEDYRMSGGRVEHPARRAYLDACLDELLSGQVSVVDHRAAFEQAVEAAVLAKLRGNVELPEPVAEVITLHYGSDHPPVAFTGVVLSDKTDYYSLPFRENAQLYTASAIAAARVQGINECADKCDELGDEHTWHISAAIRALIGGAK
jgi:hypothetical protein